MKMSLSDRSFVTDRRIELATRYAHDIAAAKPWYTGAECAAEAVRKIFGRWILDHTASIRTEYLPLYFQLINAVENRLGLHRRTTTAPQPMHPAAGTPLPMSHDRRPAFALGTPVSA